MKNGAKCTSAVARATRPIGLASQARGRPRISGCRCGHAPFSSPLRLPVVLLGMSSNLRPYVSTRSGIHGAPRPARSLSRRC